MMLRVDAESRFRAIFADAYPALRRYAHYRGVSGADADDLVSEVLAIAWRRLDTIPSDDPLPWLFAVARNVWRNQLRSQRRRERLVARLPRSDVVIDATDPGSHSAVAIRDALLALGADDQEVLRLVAWDGLDSRQLAVALGCKEGAARVRLHRARQRFAEQLEPRVTTDAGATDTQQRFSHEERPDERSTAR